MTQCIIASQNLEQIYERYNEKYAVAKCPMCRGGYHPPIFVIIPNMTETIRIIFIKLFFDVIKTGCEKFL